MSNRRKKIKTPQPTAATKPGLYVLQIRHDDDCPKLKDPRCACQCEPDVRFVPAFNEAVN